MNQQVTWFVCPMCNNDDVYLYPCNILNRPTWEGECLQCRYRANLDEFVVVKREIQDESE